MNEITRIHLGRQPFTIAVDAHKDLQEYLQAIKKAVGKSHKEVVDEVELRMAELLIERGVTGDKVIIAEDVAYLQEQLGQPRDFSEDGEAASESTDDEAPAEEPERVQKRLFRDPQRAWFGGVAAGLAAYVGINPIWVRLLFVVSMFLTSGIALLVYIILWLAMPAARTQSERLQMQGKPVTVDSLKELVDQADFEGAAKRTSQTVETVFMAIFKVVLAFVGIGFVLTAVSMLIGVIVAGSFLLIPGIEINGTQIFPVGIREAFLAACGLAVVTVVAMMFYIIGIAAIRRKWNVKGWFAGLLAGLFVLFCSLGVALGVSTAPDIDKRIDSMRHEKMLDQPEFKQLHIKGDSNYINYEQSNRYAVEVRYIGSKDRDLSQLARVQDGVLTLNLDEVNKNKHCDFWCIDAEDIQVKVFAPSIQELRVEGDAYVSADRPVNLDNLTITVRNDAHVAFHGVQVDKVSVQDERKDGYLSVVTQGIRDKHAPFPEGPALGVDANWLNLDSVNEVDITTGPNGCGEDEHFVYAERAPQVLRINGEQIDPLKLNELRRGQGTSPKHCIAID